MKTQKYYIKHRDNGQGKPYCVCYGQQSAADAKRMEKTLAGYNIVYGYDTEAEYLAAIKKFKVEGLRIMDEPVSA